MSEFICVVCPTGCLLKAEGENITGYFCTRGYDYAKEELTNPTRSISGTVRICGAHQRVLPVKTSAPIPKALLLDAAKLLMTKVVYPPVKIGDVIISDIFETGADIIATGSVK
ncbi:MAG: DUF1667 domain-containing protein [Oscillospiraceae bacterium]|nr:DUF1667 domain-containing protein [Oscillospiraceae bacterium]